MTAVSEHEAYVALGSNLGDRSSRLRDAVRALDEASGVRVLARSRIYETEPVGPPQGCYLNAVVKLRTSLSPRELLGLLLEIERAAGRRRGAQRHGPRTLDLDLLLYAERCLEEPDLVVPHPRLHERSFVLEPLRELAPELVHPRLGESVATLAERARGGAAVRVCDVRGDW